MKPQEILQMFVANENETRVFMRKPILRGDWIYSTNGHVAVRVLKQDGIDAHETDSIPKLESLFTNNKRDAADDIPRLPVAEKCRDCDGRGFNYKCQDCDGEGTFDHGQHEYDCQECNCCGQVMSGEEEDKQPCWRCNGSGDAAQPVKVGIQHFDRRYLAKIMQLPCIKFSTNPDDSMGSGYFTFDGGEGLIMPMRA